MNFRQKTDKFSDNLNRAASCYDGWPYDCLFDNVLDNSIMIMEITKIISKLGVMSYYVYALLQFTGWHQ